MWFLARKEIRHARGRFALFTALVGLVAFLVFVLTGLAAGLGEATVSGVRDATAGRSLVVFAPGSARSLARSELDLGPGGSGARASDAALAVPGVEAVDALGVSITGTVAGSTEGATDAAAAGAAPGGDATTIALVGRSDVTAVVADPATGLHAGESVQIQPAGPTVTVDRVEPTGSIQHAPVLAVPLVTWQRARYGTPDGETPPARAGALLVSTDPAVPGAVDGARAALAATGLDPVTADDAVSATPGFAEETGTIGLIRTFLLGIAALLVGTIFWVLTIQKAGPLAVLRASGARRGLLLRTYLVQVALTVGTGLLLGLVLAVATGAVLPPSAFAFTVRDAVGAAALLGVLAVAASATSMRRILTVDPLLSLGRL